MRNLIVACCLTLLGSLVGFPAYAQAPATVKICNGSQPNCPVISPTNPLPVSGGTPYQFTASGATQSPLSVTTSAIVTLTVPTGSLAARVCTRGAINFTDDGLTNPTTGAAGVGTQMSVQCVWEQGAAILANVKVIAQTTTTSIDVSYYK